MEALIALCYTLPPSVAAFFIAREIRRAAKIKADALPQILETIGPHFPAIFEKMFSGQRLKRPPVPGEEWKDGGGVDPNDPETWPRE